MNWQSIRFDWNQVRAFLVTAEEGTLSAAARALGLTQPTLGRQVTALEEELGVALFERDGRSLMLTPAGLELLEHVRVMGEAAQQVSLSATGQSQSIAGPVRISSSLKAVTEQLSSPTSTKPSLTVSYLSERHSRMSTIAVSLRWVRQRPQS